MKISLIATIFNEENTIINFLDSILLQSKNPDEIVIVDGGSTDNTLSILYDVIARRNDEAIPNPMRLPHSFSVARNDGGKIKMKIIQKKGNRSVGRNEAIKNATGDIIVCSDAGNILDKDWIKNIVAPFRDTKVDVVAGYYKGLAKTLFQKCLIPYALVMPDKIDPHNFLPATRSIAFTKSIWKKIGGFDEELSYNEDYAFANHLKEIGATIVFAKDAVVYWIPRENLMQAFTMFYRFAYGDAESGILRKKVLFLLLRYFIGVGFFVLSIIFHNGFGIVVLIALFFLYLLWAIGKNYRYVNNWRAIYILPILQLCADFAVLSGTVRGYITKNKLLSAVLLGYILLMLSVINWGNPNPSHPYNYHMDEWHQFMAVKSVFLYGTPNIPGAAHGTLFQFFLSGIYLLPFIALGFIHQGILKTSLLEQNTLFIILRMNTLLFGFFSLVFLAKIAKDFIKIRPALPVIFFAATPIWLSLSNYFKYDIALIFWIILAVYFFLKFSVSQKQKQFLFAAIASGLAVGTKISAIPLMPLVFVAFLLFTTKKTRSYKTLFWGFVTFIITFCLFGIPDFLFGKAIYGDFFSSNLSFVPSISTNFILDKSYWLYLFFDQYQVIFGHIFYYFYLFALCYWLFVFIKNKDNIQKYTIPFFLLIAVFLFGISLIPLKLSATGNRSLVMLPFFALLTAYMIKDIYSKISHKKHRVLQACIIILIIFQVIESVAWVAIKWPLDPRQRSSFWITQHIPKNSSIGIENIPIYQYLPDVIMKEYYGNNKKNNNYRYYVFDQKLTNHPDYFILTNYDILTKYLRITPSREVVTELRKQGYNKIVVFNPNPLPVPMLNDKFGFYLSGIVPMWSISIYKK